MKVILFIPKVVLPVLCLGIMLLVQTSCKSPSERMKEPQKEKVHVVEIIQMQFKPAEIQVSQGDVIQFINHDMVAHDVTEQNSKAWSSAPLQPAQSWTLKVSGSADYYCSIHPVMKGKITVEP